MQTSLMCLAAAAALCLLTTALHAADSCAAEVKALACQDLGISRPAPSAAMPAALVAGPPVE